MFLERGKMTGPDDSPRPNDSNSQLMVGLLRHVSDDFQIRAVDRGMVQPVTRVEFDSGLRTSFNIAENLRE